jgi:hypothetical protein
MLNARARKMARMRVAPVKYTIDHHDDDDDDDDDETSRISP